MQINLARNTKNSAFIDNNDKAIVLFFGLALWMFIPILGVFPLLFFVHLNRKPNSKLNLLIILLVILSNTIFVSSLDIFADLAVHVDNYERLGSQNPFAISGERGLEFILWLVSYPVHIISHGSRYAFIFFWSFVFNAVTILVIAKGLSPRNYGLLSIFIIATPNFFGNQGLLIRQYVASVIFLVAVIYVKKKFLSWGLYVISLLAHISSIIYLPILLLYNKFKFLNTKAFKISLIGVGLFLPFNNAMFVKVANLVASILPSFFGAIIIAKTNIYLSENRSYESEIGFAFLEGFVVFMIIMLLVKENKFATKTERILLLLHPLLLFLMFIGRDMMFFSFRFAFILYTFAGLFYYFLIEYKWHGLKKEALPLILVVKVLYFCYFLYNINIGNNSFHYLDDRPFSSSVFDYIEIAHNGFVYDVEIKDLPNRSLRFEYGDGE